MTVTFKSVCSGALVFGMLYVATAQPTPNNGTNVVDNFDQVQIVNDTGDNGPNNAAPVDQPGTTTQAAGPIHEAFAEPGSQAPPAPMVANKPVPNPIEEMPPEEKPAGDDVQWISGYWSWDAERTDYIWVSGIWRSPPPERVWVAGYWTDIGQGQSQWTNGFWNMADASDVVVLPELPRDYATRQDDDPGQAPYANAVYNPGTYVYQQDRYVWRTGCWIEQPAEWVWVPAHYIHTPCGCVFVEGYWDRRLETRGCLFAPVYINYATIEPGFCYRPRYVVHNDCLVSSLWVRPGCNTYYFGNCYSNAWSAVGLKIAYDVSYRKNYHDPLFSYYKWQNRDNHNWYSNVQSLHTQRLNDATARPPRDLLAQRDVINTLRTNNNLAAAKQLVMVAPITKLNQNAVKIEKLDQNRINLIQTAAKDNQKLFQQQAAVTRQLLDAQKAGAGTGNTTTPGKVNITTPISMKIDPAKNTTATNAGKPIMPGTNTTNNANSTKTLPKLPTNITDSKLTIDPKKAGTATTGKDGKVVLVQPTLPNTNTTKPNPGTTTTNPGTGTGTTAGGTSGKPNTGNPTLPGTGTNTAGTGTSGKPTTGNPTIPGPGTNNPGAGTTGKTTNPVDPTKIGGGTTTNPGTGTTGKTTTTPPGTGTTNPGTGTTGKTTTTPFDPTKVTNPNPGTGGTTAGGTTGKPNTGNPTIPGTGTNTAGTGTTGKPTTGNPTIPGTSTTGKTTNPVDPTKIGGGTTTNPGTGTTGKTTTTPPGTGTTNPGAGSTGKTTTTPFDPTKVTNPNPGTGGTTGKPNTGNPTIPGTGSTGVPKTTTGNPTIPGTGTTNPGAGSTGKTTTGNPTIPGTGTPGAPKTTTGNPTIPGTGTTIPGTGSTGRPTTGNPTIPGTGSSGVPKTTTGNPPTGTGGTSSGSKPFTPGTTTPPGTGSGTPIKSSTGVPGTGGSTNPGGTKPFNPAPGTGTTGPSIPKTTTGSGSPPGTGNPPTTTTAPKTTTSGPASNPPKATGGAPSGSGSPVFNPPKTTSGPSTGVPKTTSGPPTGSGNPNGGSGKSGSPSTNPRDPNAPKTGTSGNPFGVR